MIVDAVAVARMKRCNYIYMCIYAIVLIFYLTLRLSCTRKLSSSNETDTPSLHSVASSSDTQPSDSDGPFFPPKRARSDDHLQEAKEVIYLLLLYTVCATC